MSPALGGAVELLGRSLVWVDDALAGVERAPRGLRTPTPCRGWDLGVLLRHLDDGLDAFHEAATGTLRPAGASGTSWSRPDGADPLPVAPLRAKAAALLPAWAGAPAAAVHVGGSVLEAPLLVATAALEITVHGWDVARACGDPGLIPADLAGALRGVAHGVLGPDDRPGRFAAPLPTPVGAAADVALLAYLGRVQEPRGGHPGSFRLRGGHTTRAAS